MKKIVHIIAFIPVLILAQAPVPGMGLIIDEAADEAYQATPLKSPDMGFQDITADVTKASLREFAPEIKSQDKFGTCVGWATAYYGRTIIEAHQKGLLDTAEITQLAFSPLFTYLNANVSSDMNCHKGAYLGKALEHMSSKGAAFYKDFPDLCADEVPAGLYEDAEKFKIKDFIKLFDKEDETAFKVEQVKRSLIANNPVIIGFRVDSDFVNAKAVYLPSEGIGASGHAMCVVGFDDDQYGGAFEVINSWGTSWGKNGYTWIRYEDFAMRTSYAYEIIPFPKKVASKNQLAGSLDITVRGKGPMKTVKTTGNDPNTLQFQTVEVDEETLGIGDYVTVEKYGTERYFMKANVNKPAYVYVFGYQIEKGANVLFPNQKNISAYVNAENSFVRLPSKGSIYRLNNDGVDSDYTIVLFSLEELAIHDIVDNIGKNREGSLLDKVYTELGDKLIRNDDMVLTEEAVGFNAEFEKGSVAMLVLDIKRINP
jgi:signal peptidase I